MISPVGLPVLKLKHFFQIYKETIRSLSSPHIDYGNIGSGEFVELNGFKRHWEKGKYRAMGIWRMMRLIKKEMTARAVIQPTGANQSVK